MMNFQQFVGSITSESVRKQKYRKQVKERQEWDNVTSERHSADESVTEGGQVYSSSVTLEGQTCRSDVTCESPVSDSDLPLDGQKNDNEVTSDGQEKLFLPLLFGHLPRDGEPPENPIQSKKLIKPKIRQPKKMVKSEEESHILQEPVTSESKTSIAYEEGEESKKF